MSVCTPMAIGTPPQRDVAERLGHHHRVRVVEAQAAVLLGLGQAEQAEVAELLEHLVRREASAASHSSTCGLISSSMKRLSLRRSPRVHGVSCMAFLLRRVAHGRATPNCIGRSRVPRRLVADRRRQRQHPARVARIDDAVVEQRARGVEARGLPLEGFDRSAASSAASLRLVDRLAPAPPAPSRSRSPSSPRPARRPSPRSARWAR